MRRPASYDVIHFLAGLITGLAALLGYGILAALLFLVFIIYELDQDWHIKDKAYKDIRAYAAGLYTVAALEVIRWLLGPA